MGTAQFRVAAGSADVLNALGINFDISPERISRVLDEVGITFLFAPQLHGAMKFAAPVRRDMGIRTIFNILGPLTNPAGARRQLLGVFHPDLTEILAGVLKELGSEYALVVHGEGGFDELSTFGWTKVSELKDGTVSTYELRSDEFGFRRPVMDDLKGGDSQRNAEIILRILDDQPTRLAILQSSMQQQRLSSQAWPPISRRNPPCRKSSLRRFRQK